MLGKELLRFSELALKTPAMRIDSIQIACYPRVGEGENEGHPPPTPEASSELQGWHRDTHVRATGTTSSGSSICATRATGPLWRAARVPPPMRATEGRRFGRTGACRA